MLKNVFVNMLIVFVLSKAYLENRSFQLRRGQSDVIRRVFELHRQ